jgi:hypothetical protein
MFTHLDKPEMFTWDNWSPFIPSQPLGDQLPLNSCLAVLLSSLFTCQTSMIRLSLYPLRSPMLPLVLMPNSGAESPWNFTQALV